MNFCIIGLGNHARTKIFPNILSDYKNIYSVTRNNKNKIKNIKNFKKISLAFNYLGQNCIYIISTPPNYHYYPLKYLLKKNVKNIYVEKPILINFNQISNVINLKKNNQRIIENYPYKKSIMFQKMIKYFFLKQNKIKKITIKFIIPSLPINTFRKKSGVSNSSLYDIGCYPIDLLCTLGLINKKHFIKKILYSESQKKFFFSFNIQHMHFSISVGLGKSYLNYIKFNEDKKKIKFNKIFYARKAIKTISHYNHINRIIKKILIKDKNTFMNYFINHKKYSNKHNLKELDNSYMTIKFLNLLTKKNILNTSL